MSASSAPRPSADDHAWPGATAPHGWHGVPELPRQFHPRPDLLTRLDAEPGCRLVLVSAPAGTGKTALVTDWVRTRRPAQTAWITFDEDDAFWPGLGAALARLGLDVPVAALPTAEVALDLDVRRRLALAVASSAHPVTVVVDGYEVDSAAVAGDLDYLLKHSGRRLRLVLLTRADPVLPLYRYRLDETIVELRMADLAFTDHDAEALFEAMGVPLGRADVRLLNDRARGWVTGLRLAAKSSAGPADATERLAGAQGSIAEYLVGEVLQAHPPRVRDQLMALSVPDTIEPGLAEELVGQRAGRTLAALEHVNVFIEPVPEQAGHYRFQPFFRDLLRAELAYRAPATLLDLHVRTAAWFAGRGMLGPAVHHHGAAGRWDLAAEAVVRQAMIGRLLADPGTSALVQTLRAIPDDLDHDAAAVVRGALALIDGDVQRVDVELTRFEGRREPRDESMRHAVVTLQAARARRTVDPVVSLALARRAARLIGTEQPAPGRWGALRALVALVEGHAELRLGRPGRAEDSLRRASSVREAGTVRVESLGLLALLAGLSGDLVRADALASEAIAAGENEGAGPGERPAYGDLALAWLATERSDPRTAGEHLRAARRTDLIASDPVARAVATWVDTRLGQTRAETSGALAALRELVAGLAAADVWIAARTREEIVRLLLLSGDAPGALAELDGRPVSPSTALLTARARADLGDDEGATRALVLACSARASLPVRVGAILVRCEQLLGQGDATRARECLGTAVTLARRSGLRRPFREAAPAVRRLLAREESAPVPTALPSGGPLEDLTAKELEVLEHLGELLTTEEIAAAMYISVNTVRTHVRHILRKLGVSRRNAAVRVARQYELLGH
ncbi:LuxR C-terminal-related transcriptional regulator [Aeromicrobium senzhongii]|nr:LuxR C-terminal-related transcriptional regulator [Aeromicrobium senzhongii]